MALLNPKDARKNLLVTVDIGDGHEVRARREDVAALVFSGRLPLSLLQAVQKMIDMPGATNSERLEAMAKTDVADFVQAMRVHAVDTVIEPKLTLTDDGDENAVPVTYLSMSALLAIWQATTVVPKVTAASATKFRRRARGHDAPAASHGGDVPPAAEPVAAAGPELEVITQ